MRFALYSAPIQEPMTPIRLRLSETGSVYVEAFVDNQWHVLVRISTGGLISISAGIPHGFHGGER